MNYNDLLILDDKAFKEFSHYIKQPSGISTHLARLSRYKWRYVLRALSRLGFMPRSLIKSEKTFWGKNLNIYVSDPLFGPLSLFGTLIIEEHPLTRFLIKKLKPSDVFYDVGANHGFYTLLADELANEVHSFEPLPSVFRCLENSMKGARADHHLNNIALSDVSGEADFYDSTAKSGSTAASTLMKNVAGGRIKKYGTISVPTLTLDKYVSQNNPPTIIKIDVEGAEELVVKGAMETFRKYKPLVVMEVWGRERLYGNSAHFNAINSLYSLGYKAHLLDDDGELHFLDKAALGDHMAKQKRDNIVFI